MDGLTEEEIVKVRPSILCQGSASQHAHAFWNSSQPWNASMPLVVLIHVCILCVKLTKGALPLFFILAGTRGEASSDECLQSQVCITNHTGGVGGGG